MNTYPAVSKICILISCFVAGVISPVFAKKNGYKIRVHITNCQDTALQLCNYYGKPGQVNIISTQRKKKANELNFVFESDSAIVGGIYMLLFKNKPSQFEFIIENGDTINIAYDFSKPNETGVIRGTEEAKQYLDYIKYLMPFSEKYRQFDNEMRAAKTKQDSSICKEKIKALTNETNVYRKNYTTKYPTSLLTKFFILNEEIEFPATIKGNKEKENEYVRYHLWDNFDFSDDRLVYTPFLESKLQTYLSLTPEIADSINLASDMLLKKMETSKEQYKYTLNWMVRAQENAKLLFGDDCFIYIVENYFLKGKANWANDSTVKSYQKKISLLAKNVIGVKAPDINILDINDHPTSIKNIYPKHEYSVLFFYSPTCNHCTDELPKLDSAVASLKRDIVIVGIDAFREEESYKKLISNTNYTANWIHLHDPKRTDNYTQNYAVYTTPILYLINRKGVIVGKRFDHNNIKSVLEYIDKSK